MLCMAMLPHTCVLHMSMLLFHSATAVWLHYVLILICLSQKVLIDLVQTYTYSMIVYKSQEINWYPQSDSLGVFPLKQTQSHLFTF